jgi:O-antigen ligase
MYQKYLRYALYGVLIATAIVPLVYIGGLLYPFVTVRALLFRILVSLGMLLFAGSVLTGSLEPAYKLFKKPIVWLPAILLVWSFFASAFGIDFYHSFWSSFNRMDGLISEIYYVVYFYLLVLTFKQKQWTWFLKAVGVVSLVVAGSAIMEKIGWITFTPLSGTSRVGGLIDNAAFLASYLTMTSFLSLWFAYIEKGWEKWFWALVSALGLFTILLSATRGAAVGLVGALCFALIVLIWRKPHLRKIAGGSLLVVILAVVGGFVFRSKLQHNSIPIVNRLANISTKDITTNSRLFVWQNTLSASLERPLVGYGLENFEYVYNKFYDPTVMVEDWFDRSHNSYLDALITTGFPGLILYLAMFGAVGIFLKKISRKYPAEAFFLSLLFVAYAVQDFFVFDTINTLYVFYALLAYLFIRACGEDAERSPKKFALSSYALVGGAIIVCVALYWTVALPFKANQALAEAYTYQIVDVSRSFSALDRGLSYNTFADMEYGYQLYDMYFVKLAHQDSLEKGDLDTAYKYSIAELQKLTDRYPWNARLYLYLGHIADQHPSSETVDNTWLEGLLSKGTELSPKRVSLYYAQANIYLRQADALPKGDEKTAMLEKAITVLKSYITLVPNLDEPNLILADVLRGMGRVDESAEYFEKGLATYNGDLASAQRITSVYLNAGKYQEALPFLKRVVKSNKDNDNLQFDLAKVYYLTGDVDSAVDILNALDAKKSPALSKEPSVVNQILNSFKK